MARELLVNRTLRKVPMEIDSPFDPAALGLKEIGNLASWTVSSCKPGCGVDALRDDDTGLFWQYVSIFVRISFPANIETDPTVRSLIT